MRDDDSTLDITVPGINDAVVNVTDRADELADQLAGERSEFDAEEFEVTDAYVFGSIAAGEGTPGQSDLDICLCVPPWESPGDVTHPAAYRPIADAIMERLHRESDALLPESTRGSGVTAVDVWIAEPSYNADHLGTSVVTPVYFPDTSELLSPEVAAERIRQHAVED